MFVPSVNQVRQQSCLQVISATRQETRGKLLKESLDFHLLGHVALGRFLNLNFYFRAIGQGQVLPCRAAVRMLHAVC